MNVVLVWLSYCLNPLNIRLMLLKSFGSAWVSSIGAV